MANHITRRVSAPYFFNDQVVDEIIARINTRVNSHPDPSGLNALLVRSDVIGYMHGIWRPYVPIENLKRMVEDTAIRRLLVVYDQYQIRKRDRNANSIFTPTFDPALTSRIERHTGSLASRPAVDLNY